MAFKCVERNDEKSSKNASENKKTALDGYVDSLRTIHKIMLHHNIYICLNQGEKETQPNESIEKRKYQCLMQTFSLNVTKAKYFNKKWIRFQNAKAVKFLCIRMVNL